MILNADNILLMGSLLLFSSIIVSKAGHRFGIPVLLLFLGVGMIFGSDGFGILFSNPNLTQFIGAVSLCFILFSGGMETSFSEIKPVIREGVVLATAGVVITTAVTGFFIYYLSLFLDGFVTLTLSESLLLAAVMSSTDSPSVFSILRSKGLLLKKKLAPTLELESGSNDPMAYLLTLLLIQVAQSGGFEWFDSVRILFMQLLLGGAGGYLLGRVAVWTINRINIQNLSLYPILLLAFVMFTFSVTDSLGGNGYLAVYIAGLVVGNSGILHKDNLITFFGNFSWLFQIAMFLTLGLLVNPNELLPVAGMGLAVGVFMILFARPFSVHVCLIPFNTYNRRELAFISWVGLRGAVPIIFATYPWVSGLPHAQTMFNLVFFITILSLVVQGTTVGVFARWLKLIESSPSKTG